MTTYYVDPVNGADANNGLGPDASNATNKPWKTLAKLLGAAGFASGDTAYLAPGTYRELVTAAMTSATVETKVLGDPQNKQGFKDSSGVAVGAGPVIWTAYTSGDKAAPGSTLFTLSDRDFLTFQYIWFIQGSNVIVNAAATSHDIKFLDCAFTGITISSNGCFTITAAAATALHWLIDRCIFMQFRGTVCAVTVPQAATTAGDVDVDFVIQNSIGIYVASFLSGGGTTSTGDKPGGLVVRNCTILGNSTLLGTSTAAWSTTVTSKAYNNVVLTSGTAISANASGQIVEDYNLIQAGTARTNVTAGTHTIADNSYAPLFHFGQERLWAGFQRRFFEPIAGSPWLGFGNDGTQTAYDERNNPRPAGGLSALPAVGALERSNTWGQETITVHGGTNAIACIGPGYQDFLVPVDATATTVTVYLRYGSNYTGPLPIFEVLQNDELGISYASDTVTAAVNTWDQRSLTFTASKSGFVTIRVRSQDTSGYGRAIADDFAFS